jgi:hypothetical protein
MSEAGNLFTMLRQSADPGAVSAIEELVRDAPDHALSRVNAVDFRQIVCREHNFHGAHIPLEVNSRFRARHRHNEVSPTRALSHRPSDGELASVAFFPRDGLKAPSDAEGFS